MSAAQPSPDEQPISWLVLVYRIPSEPTRLRSTAWRRLKSLGAVYLQNSVAALPKDAASERALRKLRHDIIGMSGTAVLLDSAVLVGEETVMSVYQAARTDEFEELVDRCEDFLADVQKEWAAAHFTYAELEENEADYTKLVTWAEKIRDRDRFSAPGGEAASAALERCHAALEEYAARVYAEEPEGH
ncbi:Chromate resistance protein ChrB [Curtobacterium ammoniigenes]|uniref:Chromate resistance protein ChrB n=1 Tax=Curtobacterium ammoniigenes TaxID=395387 RepID=UPI00082F45DF|nr:Chromate resistance protein ChrB [Curtobacterium ammoniigenes]